MSPDASALASSLQLPGPNWFPESLTSAADGTIFVGSLGTGEVAKYTPGSIVPEVIIPAANPAINVAGVLVDDTTSTLWVCADSFTGADPEARSYDFSGKLKKVYKLPDTGVLCGDFAFDAKHNMYVGESKRGNVYVLTDPTGTLKRWAGNGPTDPNDLLAPTPMSFGADGIVVVGQNVYVNNYSKSSLLRIPINADGTAGTVVPVTVTPPLQSPDGMRFVDAKTMIVVENINPGGRLTKINLVDADTATTTVLRNGLRGPTGVTLVKGSYWVSEGQLDIFLGFSGGPPSLPFMVQRTIQQ